MKILNFSKIFLKICNRSQNFYFLFFSEFKDHYWATKLFKSGLLDRNFETKMVLNFFIAKLTTFFFNFAFFSFFLFDLFTNKARKLEFAEANPSMVNIPICQFWFFLLFLGHILSLCFSLSLSLC